MSPVQAATRLNSLLEYGQSYWLDNLTREMIQSGELNTRVQDEGLRGITSNPKTFATSVQQSDLYEQDIAELSGQGKSDQEIYDQLMIDDVQRACDILMPVYEKSEGLDGYVSLEVDPRLARSTDETRLEAQRLWQTVDRRNLMIKIPGTVEGLPAIEESLFSGINVNITLLFSVARYEDVAAAYRRALQRRMEQGLDLRSVRSVASFFVSRIDALAHELLADRMPPGKRTPAVSSIWGKVAIAQAQLAYDSFRLTLSSAAWKLLEKAGAQPQRLLWASTSVKDENFDETFYADRLIARDTVNTMPESVIAAFASSGKLTEQAIDKRDQDPVVVLERLKELGISMDYLSQRLEDEGIRKFVEPFKEGLVAIARGREQTK